MRSKEAFAYSRSTEYFCSVAADHSAPFRRVTPRRAGACHDATGMERHDKMAFSAGGDGGKEPSDICLHTMVDDLPPSQGTVKYPKLARFFAFAAVLVFAAATLAWWVFLAWLIWHVI
jgi:hypothetical protein